MGDTIEDMQIEIEQKDNKIEFFENKIGLSGSKDLEEMNRWGLNKISYKRKTDRIMDRLDKLFNNQKHIKYKKQ